MFKKLMASALSLGLMGNILLPINSVNAESVGKCSITIDANKHVVGNEADATGACKGYVVGYVTPSGKAMVIGAVSKPVSNGEVVRYSTINGEFDLFVTVIPIKSEPNPDPAEPEKPVEKPEQPAEPEKPVEKPEQPAEPEKPVEKPEQPAEPEKPVEKPEQPAEPEKPVEKPEQPAEPEKPVEKPEQPAEPEKPVEKPEQPAEPEKPVEKPEQPAESEKPVEKPEQPAKPEKPVEKPEQPAKPEKPVENPKQPSKAEKPMKKPEQEQGAKVSGKPGSKFKGETLLTSKVSEQANVKDDRKEGKPLPNVGTSIYNMMLKPENPTERQFVVKPVEELGTKVSEQPASKFKTETLPKTTNSVENEASEQTNVKSQYDEKEGKPLPNTATNFYNMMLIGAVLVLTGGGFFLYRRKQS